MTSIYDRAKNYREYPSTATINNKLNAPLPFIHYSNRYWDKERTIFGKEEKGLFYNYDDRLISWNYESHKKGLERAKKAERNTANYWQEYLRGYYTDDQLELRHLLGGVNWSNGYTYYAFGYKMSKKETE